MTNLRFTFSCTTIILAFALFIFSLPIFAHAATGTCTPTVSATHKFICTPSVPAAASQSLNCVHNFDINADNCDGIPAGYTQSLPGSNTAGGCVFVNGQYACSPQLSPLPTNCKVAGTLNMTCSSVPDKYRCTDTTNNTCGPITTTPAPSTNSTGSFATYKDAASCKAVCPTGCTQINNPKNGTYYQCNTPTSSGSSKTSCESTCAVACIPSTNKNGTSYRCPATTPKPAQSCTYTANGTNGYYYSCTPASNPPPAGAECTTNVHTPQTMTCKFLPPGYDVYGAGPAITPPRQLPAGKLTYYPLEPFPGIDESGGANFGTIVAFIFRLMFSIGGLIATVSLVIGGITYMVSEVVDKKAAARSRITSALWGLFLLIITWLLLYTVNPQLLTFGTIFGDQTKTTPTPTPTQTPTGSTLGQSIDVKNTQPSPAPTSLLTTPAPTLVTFYDPTSPNAIDVANKHNVTLEPSGPGVASFPPNETSMLNQFSSDCAGSNNGIAVPMEKIVDATIYACLAQ